MRSKMVVLTVVTLMLVLFVTVAQAAPLAGAIFTTTPNGGIVNENVRYESKLEVYLDGGPGPNAPQTAAGLPDGQYYFQVTDPSGKVLLSEDPAKCRLVQVSGGVIVQLLSLGQTYTVGKNTLPCSIQNPPTPPYDPALVNGVAGPSGRHDTNVDIDHGPPAIVVQLMPFFDTPNPGGVYKAWIIPADRYVANGGSPDALPTPYKVKGQQIGYNRDPGFGPPRDQVKTDNFKVKEKPPMLEVFKSEDLNGNGMYDPGEPMITGWKVTLTETLFDGTQVTSVCYTPCLEAFAPGSTVTVEEDLPPGWYFSYVTVDGVKVIPQAPSIPIVMPSTNATVSVLFGNFMNGTKTGYKFHDLNANAIWDMGEPGLPDWVIQLSGTDGKGNPVTLQTTTGPDGKYEFSVPPGTYTVSEICPQVPAWYQSLPASLQYACGGGVYPITLISQQVDSGNNFGNFQPVSVSAYKYYDLNENDQVDAGEPPLDGVQFCLYNASGNPVTPDDFVKLPQPACQTTGVSGLVTWGNLLPGTYTVKETEPEGWWPTGATEKTVTLTSMGAVTLPFGNVTNCAGLTPGFWLNWNNHYTASQFLTLLQGTIAEGNIPLAEQILAATGCDDGDALNCMARFLLSDQLSINLTQHTELPNPSGANLFGSCRIYANGAVIAKLSTWIELGKTIWAADAVGYTRDAILDAKNGLAAFANK